MKITAPAKINVALDILGKDSSGYHKIQTIFRLIKLSDRIELKETQQPDDVSIIHGPQISGENLALKAVHILKKYWLTKTGNALSNIEITIEKNIPIASGLGGASSNAAAVLKGLNQLWDLKLTPEELHQLGIQLGMDVPFFLSGFQTALGTNYGEQITELPSITNIEFTISPKSGTKTKDAYSSLDLSLCGQNINKTDQLIQAIKKQDAPQIIQNLHNDFEQLYSKIQGHLSGSGPSTFTARIS